MEKNFKFDVLENIAVLSEGGAYSREMNIVSFNGRKARLDVRVWKQDGDGKKVPLRGIQLTDDEARALADAINKYLDKEAQE